MCDGTKIANPNPVCGRSSGMALHHQSNQLYVCDAFFGFGVLGPRGGLFVYSCRQLDIALSVMDSTGRLLKYDAKTKEVTVLLRNLSLAAGVAVDEEEKFVMVTDFTANRTRKITLQGGRSIIETIQATPDNIKRTRLNKFWLAAAGLLPTGVRMNGNGTVLETVNLERWYGNKSVFEVQELGTKALYSIKISGFHWACKIPNFSPLQMYNRNRFCNAVYVHQPTGNVYFTDAASAYEIRHDSSFFLKYLVRYISDNGEVVEVGCRKEASTVLFRNLTLGIQNFSEGQSTNTIKFVAYRTKDRMNGNGTVLRTINLEI
ncbi:hypothetical protein Gotri_020351 [Gossypium trilobum]|uniref:Strictosidine synthase conserved region domain-containing protein n=1 Tax=Gossypium trilobum TaxID=34281 RepID=A0A7J9D9B0_9ROSI|nr:hypothetical protein [Gossypium trilobum]